MVGNAEGYHPGHAKRPERPVSSPAMRRLGVTVPGGRPTIGKGVKGETGVYRHTARWRTQV